MGEKIMIGLACPEGTLSAELQDYLAFLHDGSASRRLPYQFVVARENRKRPVEYAENLLVGTFLASDCDRLWVLAADMIPYPSTHLLLELDADVALGWSWIFKSADETGGNPILARNVLRESDHEGWAFSSVVFDSSSPTPIEDVVCGMHSAAIRRRVFESPAMRLPSVWTDGIGRTRELTPDMPGYAPPFFRSGYRPDGYLERTDDFDFCWRARQAGFRVAVHPGSCSGHQKTADVGIFAMQLSKLADMLESERSRTGRGVT